MGEPDLSVRTCAAVGRNRAAEFFAVGANSQGGLGEQKQRCEAPPCPPHHLLCWIRTRFLGVVLLKHSRNTNYFPENFRDRFRFQFRFRIRFWLRLRTH